MKRTLASALASLAALLGLLVAASPAHADFNAIQCRDYGRTYPYTENVHVCLSANFQRVASGVGIRVNYVTITYSGQAQNPGINYDDMKVKNAAGNTQASISGFVNVYNGSQTVQFNQVLSSNTGSVALENFSVRLPNDPDLNGNYLTLPLSPN